MSDAPRRVTLGISGGIAAYKATEVVRGFQRAGCDVSVVMTRAATRFVTPLTFAALTGRPVAHGVVGDESDAAMAHVAEGRDAELFVVAPATANVLAKLAGGIADDWLTTFALASRAPLLLAPAMNTRMWEHPAVAQNLRILESRGAAVVPPEAGSLACGEVGAGRLAEPERIVAAGLARIESAGAWSGRTVLVTSGPTHEDLDLVRYVGNRSSGRMGHAIAAAARDGGAAVRLVTGPTELPDPPGCEVVRVRSAEEMAGAVDELLPGCHAAFFAAAVADFRPARQEAGKIRRQGRSTMSLELVATPDILARAVEAETGALLVGFAAEVDDVVAAGRAKLARKGCRLLAVNRVDGDVSPFGSEENEIVLLEEDSEPVVIGPAPKAHVARRLLSEVARRLEGDR